MTAIWREISHHWRVYLSASRVGLSEFMAEQTPGIFFGTSVPRYIMQTAFFVLLAQFAGGPELARFALLGNAIQIAVNMGLVGMGSTVESEKWIGTLPHLIAVPSNKLPALMGRGTANVLEGTVGVAFALAGGMLLFRTSFPPLRVLMAVPVILLIIASILGMGMLLGAIMLPTRYGTLMSNLAAYVMMIICGVNFPVSALPVWVQVISHSLPLTNGLLAVRGIIDGAGYSDVLGLIGAEVALGIAYTLVGYFIFERRLRRTRQTGAIELF